MRYPVIIPDINYWRAQINCQFACPVGTDARGYIQAIAAGDFEKAYLIARGPNPLASICGRVCGAPCEAACRRGSIDEPISIRALKRVACEPEHRARQSEADQALIAQLRDSIHSRDCAGLNEAGALGVLMSKGRVAKGNGQEVGIVGSGPAGLAAAHDLALMGFCPVVYEMERVPAGMLYLGIPEYRLPRDVIRAEVALIESLGVAIHTGTHVGKDVSLSELQARHPALILAVGAKKSRGLNIPNVGAEGVFGGVEFLRDVALGDSVKLGQKVVVIGGGNVAYDVSRTVLRHEEGDVSRTAARMAGVREVHLCCLESETEMPADEIEIREGEEEGVIRHNSMGPDQVLIDGEGKVRGVRFVAVKSIFDADGRFNPVFDKSCTTEIEADSVLLAIGQAFDLSFIDPDRDGIQMTERGLPAIDDAQMTTREGTFVAGDLATGPKLMIHAIASGKQAARSVYRYLVGQELPFEVETRHFAIEPFQREPGYEGIPRQSIPTRAPAERVTSVGVPVEYGLPHEAACAEAKRCLDCGVNTIFDGSKCILCGGCVDVCPELCLKLVPIEAVDNDAADELLKRHVGDRTDGSSAIIKDETRCIRCGCCADRCPVGAITMERFQFREVAL